MIALPPASFAVSASASQPALSLPEDFVATLDGAINAHGAGTVAVLVLSLHRSDRIAALTTPGYAKQVQECLAEQILAVLREKDHLLFVSADECWLMLPQLASEALAILAVHRLLNALSKPLKVAAQTIFFNPIIGVACAPLHGQSALTLLRLADAAQKSAQRDNEKFLMAPASADQDSMPENLLEQVEQVLDANRLTMCYQPKIDLRTRRVVSVEALVRWPSDHPLAVETTRLIDIAERYGLIELLTMRVFNQVLHEVVNWRHAGMQMLVWVNLSARLLSHEQLPKILSRVLSIWDVPASSIGLEITESALIHDIEHTTSLLFELKDLGFHLSIDDFGTGYSSLAYLRRFPIDELKIDRMFIHGMSESLQDRQIVQSIIGLAHNFGLPVVAEGVEDGQTLAALELLGCDQIQGFWFAKPMPGDQLIDWCNSFHRAAKK